MVDERDIYVPTQHPWKAIRKQLGDKEERKPHYRFNSRSGRAGIVVGGLMLIVIGHLLCCSSERCVCVYNRNRI